MIYKNCDSSLEIVSEKDVVYIFDSVLKICPPLHLEIFGHAKQGEYFSALIIYRWVFLKMWINSPSIFVLEWRHA